MARQARKRSGSGIYHLMLRGINQQTIFEEDGDGQRFIQTLGYYKAIGNYMLYGYCLMNNHVHLLIKETEESTFQAIKRISSSYVYWYNRKYDRCGHLFQER
jgi:putative transposase